MISFTFLYWCSSELRVPRGTFACSAFEAAQRLTGSIPFLKGFVLKSLPTGLIFIFFWWDVFPHWNTKVLSWEVKIPVQAGAALPTQTWDDASLPREPVPASSSSSSFLHWCSKWDGARREQGLQINFTAGKRWVLALFHSLPTTPKSLLKYFFSLVTCAHQESVNSEHAWDGISQTGNANGHA